MSERKLVTIRIVDEVRKHPNADVLDLVRVGGWQCVSKLGTFKPGDRCVYVEIDAFVPVTHPAFAFLAKTAIKWNGREGARIKTIRLRQEISQGLLIPISEVPEIADSATVEPEADDFSEAVGVVKWDRVLPASLGGVARGNFPSFLRKTDQERVQNYWNGFGMHGQVDRVEYQDPETGETVAYEKPRKYIRDTAYEVTVKLDGSSMTVYRRGEDFGVCSRNLDLVEAEGNAFWREANRLGLRDRLASFGRDIALQGELIGPTIQGNNEKLTQPEFRVFDIFDIQTGKPMTAGERYATLIQLNIGGREEEPLLESVPVIEIRDFDFDTIEAALAYADGPSLNPEVKREGVVFKAVYDPEFSFKIVSNAYLLANGDR